jgi:hypothetical protein
MSLVNPAPGHPLSASFASFARSLRSLALRSQTALAKNEENAQTNFRLSAAVRNTTTFNWTTHTTPTHSTYKLPNRVHQGTSHRLHAPMTRDPYRKCDGSSPRVKDKCCSCVCRTESAPVHIVVVVGSRRDEHVRVGTSAPTHSPAPLLGCRRHDLVSVRSTVSALCRARRLFFSRLGSSCLHC